MKFNLSCSSQNKMNFITIIITLTKITYASQRYDLSPVHKPKQYYGQDNTTVKENMVVNWKEFVRSKQWKSTIISITSIKNLSTNFSPEHESNLTNRQDIKPSLFLLFTHYYPDFVYFGTE